ncbi:hypothetical protein TIFTF001_017359 [Ficus carica]|uniref:Uncharacterized protein n=1 Tax=Ficus carica TaxID=3494 RepID=A0AA88DJ08_FICCA|nr:hypothetical protein TIFTF001_017359 [Ficus carica]
MTLACHDFVGSGHQQRHTSMVQSSPGRRLQQESYVGMTTGQGGTNECFLVPIPASKVIPIPT